jgi:hypothetical protein
VGEWCRCEDELRGVKDAMKTGTLTFTAYIN